MALRTTYYTLIGSLPALPRDFEEAERVPISERALAERMKMLEPHDAEVVEAMADFLTWERQPLERTDQEFVCRFDQFMATVNNQFAQELIRYTVNCRLIVAALRCRRLKRDPPVGIEPIASRIARNWDHPDFRMGYEYPWIEEVDAQLSSDAIFELERTILNIIWKNANKLADQFHFAFEAVLLYVTRWKRVYRWTQRNAEAGHEKFEQLVSEAMGEYAAMWEE